MRIAATIFFICFILLGCRSGIDFQKPLDTPADDSFQYAFGPGRHNVSHTKLTPPLSLRWTVSLSGGVSDSHPSAEGNMILIPTLGQGVDIYDIRNGDELGWINVSGAVLGTPAAKNNHIYIPVTGGTSSLIEVDARTGDVLLDINHEPVELPVLVLNDRIITSGIFGTISCYVQRDSTAEWTVRLPKPALSAPCGSGDKLFVSSSNGDLYCFAMENGMELWRLHTGAAIHASPVCNGSMVIALNRKGECFAVDAESGTVIWSLELGITVFSTPALENDLLIISGTDGILRAYTSMDGSERWKFSFGRLPAASPVIAGPHVVAVSMNGRIVLLDKQNGKPLWEATVKGRIRTSPIVNGAMLCILTEEGELYGFGSVK